MKLLLFLVFFFILPFVFAGDPCKNGIQDPNEQGVDCGFKACKKLCVITVESELTLPGETPKTVDKQQSSPSTQLPSLSPQQSVVQQLPTQQPQQTPQLTELPAGPVDLEELPDMLPETPEEIPTLQKVPEQIKKVLPEEGLAVEPPVKPVQEIPASTKLDWGKITGNMMAYFVTVFRYLLYLSLLFVILWGGYRSYNASQPHTDPEVIKYIKSCLERKIPKEKINAKLKEAGHTQKTIEHHFTQIKK